MKKEYKYLPEGEKGIIAGDIGGTKTHLGLYGIDAGELKALATVTYPSQEVTGLEEMISDILERHEVPVAAACFGIACPVVGGACSPTNLSWSVSDESLRSQFGWQKVQILNDLATTAIAAPRLDPAALTTLNPGQPQTGGNMALVAPGTGLGQALLQRFCRIFGAVAGNLALTGMATGGVYLGGGIPPKILPALKTAAFMEGFTAKGRFSDFMTAIPVQVICEDRAALLGAAQRAYELATQKADNYGDR